MIKKLVSAVMMAGALAQISNAMGPMGDATHRHLYKSQEWIWQKEDNRSQSQAKPDRIENFTGGHFWSFPVAFGMPNHPPLAFGMPNHPPYVAFGMPNHPPYVAFGMPNHPPYVAFGMPNHPPYVAFGMPNHPPYVAFGMPNHPPYVAFGMPNKPPYVALGLPNTPSTGFLALGALNKQPSAF